MSITLIHPFLLAAFLALSAFCEVRPLGSPSEAAALGLGLVLLAGAGFALFRLGVKNTGKAAPLTTVLLFTLGLSGELILALKKTYMQASLSFLPNLDNHSLFVLLLAILLIPTGLLIYAILRSKGDLRQVNQAVTVVMATLLATTFGGLWLNPRERAFQKTLSPPPLHLKMPEQPPDIYFVILDAHTSVDALRDYWNYDSKPLMDFLRKAGFQIAPGARSEYHSTTFSLASRLNMRYPPPALNDWADRYTRNAMIRLIEESTVPETLSSAGYKIVNLSMLPLKSAEAKYPILRCLCYRSVRLMLLDRSFLRLFSLLSPPPPDSAKHNKAAALCSRKIRPLSDLAAVAAESCAQPRFVFVHSLITHQPYVFARNGKIHAPVQTSMPNSAGAYLDQLVYADRLLIQTLTRLIEKSVRPPVIILQGDHGFRYLSSSPADNNRESYCMLQAILLPSLEKNELPDDFAPVNTFRLVFNHLFATRLPYLTPSSAEQATSPAEPEE
jgi:hypothetical protein